MVYVVNMSREFPGTLSLVAIDEPAEAAYGVFLDPSERLRQARFVQPMDRLRFGVARGLLRRILGTLLSVEPGALRFEWGDNGKPRLVWPASDVEFNVSHGGALAVVAVTRGRAVGVDLEVVRAELATDALAATVFSAAERLALAQLPLETRTRAFFRVWTRKEAFTKATGAGLSADLSAFDVSADERPLLLATRPDATEATRWQMGSLDLPSGYEGAWAVARFERSASERA